MIYTVYLDLLFLLDFIMDYLLLYSVGKISGAKIKRKRLCLAATFGAVCSVAYLFLKALTLPFMIVTGILTVFIAYGAWRWKLVLVFAGVSALFGGMVLSVNHFIGEARVSLRVLAVATAISYVVILTVFRKSATGVTKKEYVHIEIEKNSRKTAFYALVDSGNNLCDPVTNTPVLICEWNVLEGLFDDNSYRSLSAEELVLRGGGEFRLIPFKTIGGAGILPAFKAGRVVADGKEREVLIAITNEKLAEVHGYGGIIGLEEE